MTQPSETQLASVLANIGQTDEGDLSHVVASFHGDESASLTRRWAAVLSAIPETKVLLLDLPLGSPDDRDSAADVARQVLAATRAAWLWWGHATRVDGVVVPRLAFMMGTATGSRAVLPLPALSWAVLSLLPRLQMSASGVHSPLMDRARSQSVGAVFGEVRNIYKTVVGHCPQADEDGLATVQFWSGAAKANLGSRYGRQDQVVEGVTQLRAAAEGWARGKRPVAWAMVQNRLALALKSLGNQQDGNQRLEEAAVACRAELHVFTRADFPMNWAAAQNNLGNALESLGKRLEDVKLLNSAVAAYQAALEVRTREQFPDDWAGTQNNLGTALQALGECEEDGERLEQAMQAYSAALQVTTRQDFPISWAMTQHNLGSVLHALAKREEGFDRPPASE